MSCFGNDTQQGHNIKVSQPMFQSSPQYKPGPIYGQVATRNGQIITTQYVWVEQVEALQISWGHITFETNASQGFKVCEFRKSLRDEVENCLAPCCVLVRMPGRCQGAGCSYSAYRARDWQVRRVSTWPCYLTGDLQQQGASNEHAYVVFSASFLHIWFTTSSPLATCCLAGFWSGFSVVGVKALSKGCSPL